MKKLLSTLTMACLSFSCFAEDYFVKVANNEYVLQHGEKSKDLGFNSSGYGAVAPVDAVYTPTYIFTYPDGTPSLFRNIQKIEYTESKVTFVKDIKSRKCCIDILDDKEDKNKCRIIGINGHNIGSFEVYEAAEDANSFTDSKSRLIYVDHSGLYIVSKEENSIESISKNYFKNGSFDFKGEIIKISAVDGTISDKAYETMKFRYARTEPVYFVIMQQIKKITGVMPQTPPPSEKAALNRMAEILDVPEVLLCFEDGQVKLVNEMRVRYNDGYHGLNFSGPNPNNYFVHHLKRNLSVSSGAPAYVPETVFRKIPNYKFDTSPEAQQRRKEIALKPWDE